MPLVAEGNWPAQPPSTNPVEYRTMYYYVRDPVEYAAVVAAHGTSFLRSPRWVLDTFGVTFGSSDTGGYPIDPNAARWLLTSTGWPAPPASGRWLGPYWYLINQWPLPPVSVPYDRDWFVLPGGTPPWISLPGEVWPAVNVFYVCTVILAYGRATGPAVPPPVTPLRQRRWVVGFEMPGDLNLINSGEGRGGAGSNNVARDASRTPDGFGFAFRRETGIVVTNTVMQYFGGGTSTQRTSWERIYVRPRVYSAGSTEFWRTRPDNGVGGEGGRLNLNASGQLEAFTVDNAGVATLIGTGGSLALNAWTRLDLLLNYRAVTGPPASTLYELYVFVNGVQVIAGSGTVHPASSALTHRETLLGNSMTGANVMELDLDDWHNATWPVDGAGSLLLEFTGLDWICGSHMQLVRATGFGSGHSVNWVGDWRTLLQNPAARGQAALTSSTNGARVEAVMDAAVDVRSQLGAAAFVVGIASTSEGGASTGQLGYRIGAGADVLTAITQTGARDWQSMLYNPTGLTTPAAITPLTVIHTKSTNVSAATVALLAAAIEYLGSWGPEDDASPTAPGAVRPLGIHNGPYIHTQLASTAVPAPVNAVGAQAGIYNGNSFAQDVLLNLPAHFWWIRNLTVAGQGAFWFPSLLGIHGGLIAEHVRVDLMVQALLAAGITPTMRTVGAGVQGNAAASTYQYVAFMDMAMRNAIAAAFKHASASASAVNSLVDATFTPEGTFFFEESLTSLLSITRCWYKGPGHATAGASLLDAAETANVAAFAAGQITTQTPLHTANHAQAGLLALRAADAGGYPALGILQYTGNGAGGTRTIPVVLNGRRPLFGVVVPMNGQAFVRDPSHTGTNSSNAALGLTSTTAIVGGGIDQILVGTTLNTSGIVYSVFVIPGGTAACENGWSCNGSFLLSPPGWSPPGGAAIPVPGVPGATLPFPPPAFPTPPSPPSGPGSCSDGWGTTRADGLPYIPISPG